MHQNRPRRPSTQSPHSRVRVPGVRHEGVGCAEHDPPLAEHPLFLPVRCSRTRISQRRLTRLLHHAQIGGRAPLPAVQVALELNIAVSFHEHRTVGQRRCRRRHAGDQARSPMSTADPITAIARVPRIAVPFLRCDDRRSGSPLSLGTDRPEIGRPRCQARSPSGPPCGTT